MATRCADQKVVMTRSARVSLIQNVFVATLSDSRRFEQSDLQKMAYMLFRAGVLAHEVSFEWRSGSRMLTAGQKIGLSSEMRRLEHKGQRDLVIAA